MGKLPYMKWFTRDWLGDPAVSKCSPATRGIWKDILDCMHELEHCGMIAGTREELARLARCTVEEFSQAINELIHVRVADVTFRNNKITIINRRMRREYKEKKDSNERVQRYRKKSKCNDDVTVIYPVVPQHDIDNVTELKRDCNGNVTPPLSYSYSKETPLPPTGGKLARASGTDKTKLIDWHLPEYQELRSVALEILSEINSRCGRRFQEQYPGFREIIERLRDGRLREEFSQIITNKLADPHFQRNRNLYRPETMFSVENFDKYLAESPDDYEHQNHEPSKHRVML